MPDLVEPLPVVWRVEMQSETKKLLESVQNGSISVDEALVRLKAQPFDDLGYAKVDLHREIRQGVPEVIYGAGKTPAQNAGTDRRHYGRYAEERTE